MSQGGTYKAAVVLINILSDRSLLLLHCSSLGSSKAPLPAESMWLLQEREVGHPEQAGPILVSPCSHLCTVVSVPPPKYQHWCSPFLQPWVQMCCHNPALFLKKIWVVFLKAMASRYLESWRLPTQPGCPIHVRGLQHHQQMAGPDLPVQGQLCLSRLCSGGHHVL